jgi:hypothetical protein
MRIFKLLLAIVLAMPFLSHAQDIYKHKDEKGQWKFSNTPPLEQREMAAPMLQAAGDCAPFKLGEARDVNSTRSATHPHLEATYVQVKLVDINRDVYRFAWRVYVRNSSSQEENVFGDMEYLDCSGFRLGGHNIRNTRVAARQTMEITGNDPIMGKMAHTAGRVAVAIRAVTIGGKSPKNPPANQSGPQGVEIQKDDKGQWKVSNTPSSDPDPSSPVASFQPAANCAPLKIGETREVKLSAPSLAPNLDIAGFQVRLDSRSGPRNARFTWRLQVKNSLPQKHNVYGTIKFFDCSGFPLGQAGVQPALVPPSPTVELFGYAYLEGLLIQDVGMFSLAIQATSVPLSW